MFYSVGSYSLYKVNPNVSGGTPTPPSFADTTSFYYDGVDDFLTGTTTYSELDGETSMTISMWIKPQTSGVWGILTSTIRNATLNEFQHCILVDTNNRIRLFKSTGSDYTYSNTNVISPNEWNHVMVCVDLSQPSTSTRGRIFVNNVDETSGVVNLNNTPFQTSIDSLYIGENQNGYLYPFNGNINEVAIWVGSDLRNNVQEVWNSGLPNDLNNLPTAPQPTTWIRSENGTWNGSAWLIGDENSDYEMRDANMVEANRENDVPYLYSNKSFTFDGVDDYIDCGNAPYLQNLTQFSVSLWAKQTTATTQKCFISDWIYNSNGNFAIQTANVLGSATKLNFAIRELGGTPRVITTDNYPFIENVWNHIVVTFNSGTANIYVNGISESFTGATLPTSLAYGNGVLDIGRFNGLGRYFNGLIDEVAVFNSELTQTDVNDIFANGVPSALPNAISHWRMGEDATWNGTNWSLNDNGSGGNNGTSQNMVLASRTNDVPLFNTKSILFDGVDDYVDCGNGASLQITGALTISAWVKTTNTNYAGIYSKGTSITPTDVFFRMQNTGVIRAFLNDVSVNVLGTTAINDGDWHHVMFVYVPSTSMTLYVDGVQDAQNTTSIPSAINNKYSDVYIGQFQFWDGNIDEVAVWDSEINISDVWDGSGKPFDISSSNPISWWRMGDFDSYPTLIDRGSGNNNGTMINMTNASIVDDVPE